VDVLISASSSRRAPDRGEIAIYRIAVRNGSDFLHVFTHRIWAGRVSMTSCCVVLGATPWPKDQKSKLLKGRQLRSRRVQNFASDCKIRPTLTPVADRLGLILTSTRRWDEARSQTPEWEGSAGLARCRVLFQPDSRHIAGSPAEWQEVWTEDSEAIGRVA
jgi:hypothetical protein